MHNLIDVFISTLKSSYSFLATFQNTKKITKKLSIKTLWHLMEMEKQMAKLRRLKGLSK